VKAIRFDWDGHGTQFHRHHVVPKHMGGTNIPSNIAWVTLAEHAEAHRLLWEQHGKLEDKVAWLMLSGKTDEGEAARRELTRQRQTGRPLSAETKRKKSLQRKGKPNGCLGTRRSIASRQKMRDAQKRIWADPDHRRRMSDAHKGHIHTLEHRQKMSAAMRGRQNTLGHKMSTETRRKMSVAQTTRRAVEARLRELFG
jgi:hypothetical protein